MPSVPKNLREFKEPVLNARNILHETGNMATAIAALKEVMTESSARKALMYETFRYTALIPEGHPLKAEFRAHDAARQRRLYATKKHRGYIIERDGGRCRHCHKEVSGRNATLDHIDPDGPNEPENLQLLCRSCNSRKHRHTNQKANEILSDQQKREANRWKVREPVWTMIENAQTCSELEAAENKYLDLPDDHWWLDIDFFSERAKELPDYVGSVYHWAEQKFKEHQEVLRAADEIYAAEEQEHGTI